MMEKNFGHDRMEKSTGIAPHPYEHHTPFLLSGTRGHVPGELLVVDQLVIYSSSYQESFLCSS